jgi:hypothetical protein
VGGKTFVGFYHLVLVASRNLAHIVRVDLQPKRTGDMNNLDNQNQAALPTLADLGFCSEDDAAAMLPDQTNSG